MVVTNIFCSIFFSEETRSQSDINKAYSHVKTIVFFIGYSRSRHSLLGSLLDAHPHMVVSDETMAFGRWKSNPDKWISSSIYTYYDTMLQASQRAIVQGRRSKTNEGSVANATSGFKYFVPNQWQGNYDQYIEVSTAQNVNRSCMYGPCFALGPLLKDGGQMLQCGPKLVQN